MSAAKTRKGHTPTQRAHKVSGSKKHASGPSKYKTGKIGKVTKLGKENKM